MRRASLYWCGLVMMSFALSVHGYERPTHRELSEKAADSSVLAKGKNVLKDLGLTSLRDPKQTFPNSNGDSRILLDLIKDGADFEDSLANDCESRPRNHFFDPLYNRPLTVLGIAIGEKSPDWALEDTGEITGQDFSFRNARDYFYKALTSTSRVDRDANFGTNDLSLDSFL